MADGIWATQDYRGYRCRAIRIPGDADTVIECEAAGAGQPPRARVRERAVHPTDDSIWFDGWTMVFTYEFTLPSPEGYLECCLRAERLLRWIQLRVGGRLIYADERHGHRIVVGRLHGSLISRRPAEPRTPAR